MDSIIRNIWMFMLNCSICYGVELDDGDISSIMTENLEPVKKPTQNTMLKSDSHVIYMPDDSSF